MKKEILQEPKNTDKKVIKGQASIKEKSEFRKFTEGLLADSLNGIKNKIIYDILIPSGKRMILDTVNTILYGKSVNTSNGYRRYYGTSADGYTDYNSASTNRNRNANAIGNTVGNIEALLDDMIDVNNVINSMQETIAEYGMVTVNDFYDMIGITNSNWAIANYGWDNIDGWRAVPCSGRYLLTMPKAYKIQPK